VQEQVRSGAFRLIKFTPNENLPLGWNGLTIQVRAEQETELPEPFYNVYKERKYALQQAVKNEAYLMGYSDEAPDPSWQTPEGAVVRALSVGGRRYGKPGGSIGVGPIFTGEEGQENG
jgi:hypothetical protein